MDETRLDKSLKIMKFDICKIEIFLNLQLAP